MGHVPPPPPTGDPKQDWARFVAWHREQVRTQAWTAVALLMTLPAALVIIFLLNR